MVLSRQEHPGLPAVRLQCLALRLLVSWLAQWALCLVVVWWRQLVSLCEADLSLPQPLYSADHHRAAAPAGSIGAAALAGMVLLPQSAGLLSLCSSMCVSLAGCSRHAAMKAMKNETA